MKRAIVVALGTGAIIASAAAFSLGSSESGPLSFDDYVATLRSIDASHEARLARCDLASGFEREFCRIETGSDRAVRRADAESAYRRTQQAARAAQRTRIEARYQVERAKCGALGGFKRDKCLVEVHATRGRSMLAAAAPYETRF